MNCTECRCRLFAVRRVSTVGDNEAGHGALAIRLKFVKLFEAAVFVIYPLYGEHGLSDIGQVFPDVPLLKTGV